MDQVYAELDKQHDGEEECDQDGEENDPSDKARIRDALYVKQGFAASGMVVHAKTDEVRSLIYEAVRPNELFGESFGDDTDEEMLEVVDIVDPWHYGRGGHVTEQGADRTPSSTSSSRGSFPSLSASRKTVDTGAVRPDARRADPLQCFGARGIRPP